MRHSVFPVLAFGVAMLIAGNAAAADPCPLEFGSRTFTADGIFVPPAGTSPACPLQVRVFLMGGGGNGGAGSPSAGDKDCIIGGGGGGSGRVVAEQLNITDPVSVIVGRAGQETRFGATLVAKAGDQGRDGSDGGAGGDGASHGGQAGGKGQTNGMDENTKSPHWEEQVIHNRERYLPNSVNGLMFPSVRFFDGRGGRPGKPPACGKSGGGGAGGFLLDYLGPHAAPGDNGQDITAGAGGKGYGAGGGGGSMGAGGAGAPGVVYVEW